MIVGKSNKMTYISLHEGAGSGDGDLDINWQPAAMESAATSYETAAKKVLDAIANLTSTLGDVSGAWTGAGADTWTAESTALNTKLGAIKEVINTNKTNLKSIAEKMTDIDSKMSAEVEKIVQD